MRWVKNINRKVDLFFPHAYRSVTFVESRIRVGLCTHLICKRSSVEHKQSSYFYGDFSLKSFIHVWNLYAFQFTNLFLLFLRGIHLVSFKMYMLTLGLVVTQIKHVTTFLEDYEWHGVNHLIPDWTQHSVLIIYLLLHFYTRDIFPMVSTCSV